MHVAQTLRTKTEGRTDKLGTLHFLLMLCPASAAAKAVHSSVQFGGSDGSKPRFKLNEQSSVQLSVGK